MLHSYQDLITLFDSGLGAQFNTRLIKGEDEPVYLPAGENCPYHQIIFAHGYYASALHEIAHWCIAGEARRLLEDFGYWYLPDGRNEKQQKEFEQVEVKPQAVEWAFCVAANKRFNVSADNLNGAGADTMAFKLAVYQQVLDYLETGFPPRAQTFIDILAGFYRVKTPLTTEDFKLDPHLQEMWQQRYRQPATAEEEETV
ncbi:elongation factor P hydroxylase [Thalassomonas viridans]|uniref:Elongation factor P hydroxylase n=1 Tax=Thalassomonas viridans TaxID=137584 RepID=A0AAF0C7W6_9GAMM|nr:elongation factor P hydroxylase [Thalassomonas viridans]WDE03585.1 elongation factor P hydroxylase [Thalassomonas viridans]